MKMRYLIFSLVAILSTVSTVMVFSQPEYYTTNAYNFRDGRIWQVITIDSASNQRFGNLIVKESIKIRYHLTGSGNPGIWGEISNENVRIVCSNRMLLIFVDSDVILPESGDVDYSQIVGDTSDGGTFLVGAPGWAWRRRP